MLGYYGYWKFHSHQSLKCPFSNDDVCFTVYNVTGVHVLWD